MVTLAEAPWQASLRRLESRTAATWSRHRVSLLSLGAAAFAVTLALGLLTAVLLSRSLARPLTEMSRAAGEIAAGNLDHPLTLDSPDELGDLARALNRMAGDLRSHEEALRAERADLAAKNAELERFAYTVSHDLKTPARHDPRLRGPGRDATSRRGRSTASGRTSAASSRPRTRCTGSSTTSSSCRAWGAS